MNMEKMKLVRVYQKERIDFKCTSCGSCCRHVEKSVPVSSMDAFRIAKHLKEAGQVQSIVEFYAQYAEPMLLHECGYAVYFLKTTGEDKACVFLKEDRCGIHEVKTGACRLYPFVVSPEDGTCYLSCEKEHHFSGGKVQIKRWMKQNFTKEDELVMKSEYDSVSGIAEMLREIPESQKDKAIYLFMFYKYWGYDLERPFMEQYEGNRKKLIQALERLLRNSK